MTYELFQQGPAAYIPIILVSLVVTLVAYGAFPLIFAKARKKVVTKKKYNWLCYGINFLVMIVFFTVMNGEPGNAAPYLLWTWVFSASGIKTLKNRGVLEGFQPVDYTKTAAYQSGQVMGSDIALETPQEAVATNIDPSPEAVQKETLMSRAYSSYVSTDPEEKCFFEEVLGSEELKAAYLEERERNQREYDKGVRINYKQSYLQFMGVLHDEYFGTPVAAAVLSPVSSEKQEEIPAVTNKAYQENSKQRYCKLCGQPIDAATKRCTGCGKQYFKGVPWKKVSIIALTGALITSLVFNVSLYEKISVLEEANSLLEESNSILNDKKTDFVNTIIDLRAEVKELEYQVRFFNRHVVFVGDDETGLYHKYECEKFTANSFWAFNTETANARGYDPCPLCH